MIDIRLRTIATVLVGFCASVAHAQPSQSIATAVFPKTGAVPNVVRFSGSFRPANGMPAQPVESVTLSVYSDQVGGTALWQETQNVAVDGEGKYSALMGSTQNDGVPMELFASGEPRWLGVQFNQPGEAEQPRVLMTSVPYALKSVDAETLGGKPASAYLLALSAAANTSSNLAGNSASSSTEMAAHGAAAPGTASTVTTVTNSTPGVKPRATNGTAGFIGVFTDATDIGNSVMQQSGGYIGVGTVPGAGAGTTPSLDLRTSPFSQIGMAQSTDYLTFFSSDIYGPAIYWNPGKDMRFGKGGAELYNAFGFTEQMRIQSSTGNVGIGTQAPGSTLDVNGNINFSGNVLYQGSTLLQAGAGQFANNLALGRGALVNSANGYSNTAVGTDALSNNTATFNTAVGTVAMFNNSSGYYNTAIGASALYGNTAGQNNIAIGNSAATSVSGGNNDNIHIGTTGSAGDNATIRIGGNLGLGDIAAQTSFFAAGIYHVSPSGGIPVVINSSGQLGAPSSSRRYKEDIQDMGDVSRGLMELRPVTFRYRKAAEDGSKPLQYGLIAEEVAEVYPDLVVYSKEGQPEAVQYQNVNAMLLNEVQRQQAEIGAQKDQLQRLAQQIDEQRQQNQSLLERLARLENALTSLPGVSRGPSGH